MKRCLIVSTALAVVFWGSTASAGKAVLDPFPANITQTYAYWDLRLADPPKVEPGGAGSSFSSEASSGAYFQVGALIGGIPVAAIRAVKARHNESGKEYVLTGDPCDNWLGAGKIYWVFLRPEPWMFGGTWEFTLLYDAADGEHKQVRNQALDITNPPRFMDGVSHVRITNDGYGGYIVSWNAPGDPVMSYYRSETSTEMMARFRYQLRLYDESGVCAVSSAIASHSPVTQRVSVHIPPGYGGRRIRLENLFFGSMIPNVTTSRSIFDTTLPVW